MINLASSKLELYLIFFLDNFFRDVLSVAFGVQLFRVPIPFLPYCDHVYHFLGFAIRGAMVPSFIIGSDMRFVITYKDYTGFFQHEVVLFIETSVTNSVPQAVVINEILEFKQGSCIISLVSLRTYQEINNDKMNLCMKLVSNHVIKTVLPQR